MNKTYRTVWCESTGTYVAVGENVKARGKRTSGARLLSRAAFAVLAAGAAGVSYADVTIPDSTNPGGWDGNQIVFDGGSGSIVFRQGGTVTGLTDATLDAASTEAVTGRQVYAVDQKAQAAQDSVNALDASAVKFNAGKTAIDVQNARITNLQNGAVAAGSKEAVTGGQLFTVDQKAQAAQSAITTLDASAVKFNAGKTAVDLQNARITNLQNGSLAAGSKEAVTGGQLFVTNQEVNTINQHLAKLGLGSVAATYSGVKYFRVKSAAADAAADGQEAVAVGPAASAAGASSIAMGDGASTQAEGEGAIAIGRQAAAAGKGTVALGDGARVESEFVEDALAMGTDAAISGDYSSGATAIGARADASAANAVAVGADAAASGTNSVALGAASAQGGNALAAGTGAQAHAANSIALGTGAGVNTLGTAGNDRTSHIAIGTRAGRDVVGNQTIALGYEAGSGVQGDQNIAIGSQAGAGVDGDLNVAIGYQANRNANEVDHATAVGSNTYAERDAAALGYQASAQGEGSVALGTQARVTSGQGVALGKNAVSDGAGVALGANSAALASDANGVGYLTGSTFPGGSVVSVGNTATGSKRRIVNVADGSATYDAVNVGQLRNAQQKVADLVGGQVAVGPDGAYSEITLVDAGGVEHKYNTVVDALGAVTSGGISVLPPEAAKYNADGTLNVAAAKSAGEAVNLQQLNETIDANAARYYSVNSSLPGNRGNTSATGYDAMAIGPVASALGNSSLAMGHQAYSQSDRAVALGYNTNALGANTTVVGNNSFAYGESGVAIGDSARSQGDNSIVIGTNAQADIKSPGQTVDNSVVIGTEAESTADNGVAIGQSALASDVRGIAQGYNAEASARDATAVGSNAHASAADASASGTNAIASGESAIASGTNAKGYAQNGIAMGRGAQAGQAAPRPDEIANNVDAIAIGTGALANAKNATSLGRAASATAEQALAIGDGSAVSGRQASALGAGNSVTAEKGLALGAANAINGAGSGATGNSNTVSGNDTQVVGNANLVAAGNAGAFGNDNTLGSAAAGSRIIGNGNSLAVADAFIMGNRASVTVAGGVALGSGSQSAAGANVIGYQPNGNATAANNAIVATRSTTGAVAVGGNGTRRQITGVAAGTADTDAVNVAQLKATGWNVRTDGDAATHVSTGQGNTVDIGLANGENNLTVTRTSANGNTVIDYALKKNLDLGTTGSVKMGDTVINNAGVAVGPNVALGNTGLVIANGPSVTTGGINAGGKTITNVAAGVNGTDAVNVDQLKGVENVANAGWNLTAEGGNPSNVAPGATVDLASSDGNIVISKGAADADVKFALADQINVSNVTVSNNLSVGGTTNLGNNTLVVRPGELAVDGNTTVNMGGNKVTNVARGEAGTDAVNVDQLTELANRPLSFTADAGAPLERKLGEAVSFTGADANIRTETTAGGVKIALARNLDLGPDGSIKLGDATLASSGLTIAGGPSITHSGIDAGGSAIVNVAAGVNDTDAVNVSQLKGIENVARTGWQLSVNGNAAGDQTQVKPGEVVDFANDDGNVVIAKNGNDVKVNLNPDLVVDSVTAGDTVLDDSGVKVGDDVTLTAAGLGVGSNVFVGNDGLRAGNVIISASTGINAGGFKITNVAAGTDPTDAVNVSQLRDVEQNVSDLNDRAVKYDGNIGDPKSSITLEGDVSTDGGKTGGTKITNLAQGEISETSTDAVNGAQLHEQGTQVADALGGNSKYENGKLVTELNVGSKTYNNVNDALNGVNNDLTDKIENVEQIANAGWQIEANGDGASKVAPGKTVEFVNGDNVEITRSTSAGGNNTIKVSMSQDITVNSVTAKEVKADTVRAKEVAIENGPTINQGGINMNNKKITNVAAGTAPTDAVNLGQLQSATGSLQNQINQVKGDMSRLNNKLSAGVAAAMATAGLPQAYLPGKSMAAIAGGTYNGESGFALGVSTISDNGKWVLKLSGNTNSRGDYGGAVGVGYQW